MNLFVTLLRPLERAFGKLALLVRHQATPLGECHRFEVEDLPRRRSGFAWLQGTLGGPRSDWLDCAVDVHRVAVRARLARVAAQLLENPADTLLAHRDLDVHLLVVVAPRELGAPDDLFAIGDEGRDELELVVVGQVHEAVLDVARVAFGREERHGLLGLLSGLDRVGVRRGEQALEPEAVNLAGGNRTVLGRAFLAASRGSALAADEDRIAIAVEVGARRHLVVIDASAGTSRTFDAFILVIVRVFVADLEAFAVLLVLILLLLLKDNGDTDIVVDLARVDILVLAVGALALLLLVAIVGDLLAERCQLGKLLIGHRQREE